MTTLTRRQFAHGAVAHGVVAHGVVAHGVVALTGAAALSFLPQVSRAAQPITTLSKSASLPPPDPLFLLLSRTSFGISDADMAHAQAIGFEAYVEQQLDPEAIDDAEVEEYVATHFPSIFLSAAELAGLEDRARSQAARELKLATAYRRWFSRRQLYEVMTEFWTNHFNIFQDTGPLRLLKIVDDREVIRPQAMGRFRDMLHASAKSPAMLFYLDNFQNVKNGPNENYARELMELHSIGVEGGFSENDVQEVARCFTGWGLGRRDDDAGTFQFSPRRHDFGEKTVLGHTIPAEQGIQDGEQVLDILAGHATTGSFLATKLCRRFVSDQPPASLVEKVAAVYDTTDGDMREMLRTLLLSDEFLDSSDAKFKRPIEFIGAVLRGAPLKLGSGAERTLTDLIAALGQVPFHWAPPNGYPDVMGYWATTNGLLFRWNFSLALGEGETRGISLDLAALIGDAGTPEQLVDHLAESLLRRPLTTEDRDDLIAYVSEGGAGDAALPNTTRTTKACGLVGLLLSSAYFQMR